MARTFQEEQKFTQWWLWLIIIGVAILPIIGVIIQIFGDKPFGDQPMSDLGLIVYALFSVAFIWVFWSIKLYTNIDKNQIKFRMRPFANRTISWSEIKSAQVIDYGFVGGWGVRWGTKYGTVYNTSGRKGLALELKNGKKLLIGTQRESELDAFVKQLKSS